MYKRQDRENLFYLDMLIGIALISFVIIDYRQQAQKRRQVEELLEVEDVIYSELSEFENREIVIHDVEVLKGQLDELFEMNCNLQAVSYTHLLRTQHGRK